MTTKTELEARLLDAEQDLRNARREIEALRLQLCIEGGNMVHRDIHGRKWERCKTNEGLLSYKLLDVDQRVARLSPHMAALRAMAIATGRAVRVNNVRV
jgi:hypothetical protein